MPALLGKLPRRCAGVAAHGGKCSIDASSKMRDRNGQLIAEPLTRGCSKCRLHLQILATAPANVQAQEVLLVYVDLETTGLRPLADEIVEVGAVAHSSNARFGSTVRPSELPDPKEPTVHGIGVEELVGSPTFKVVFLRFAEFLDKLVDNAVETSESDSSQESIGRMLKLKDPAPRILLAAHNGEKFDFPFMINEALRCGTPLWRFEKLTYVDTLALTSAAAPALEIGCKKLQCLANNCRTASNRAHRALDDTVLLRDVVSEMGDRLGTSPEYLLVPHAFGIDAERTLLNLSFVS